MKTLKDLAELVKEKEHDLAYGSETTLLGIFVNEYDSVQKIIDEETSLDTSADMTDTYKAWANAYDRMEQFINDGSDYTVEKLFSDQKKMIIRAIGGESFSVTIDGKFIGHFECPAEDDDDIIDAACKEFGLNPENMDSVVE